MKFKNYLSLALITASIFLNTTLLGISQQTKNGLEEAGKDVLIAGAVGGSIGTLAKKAHRYVDEKGAQLLKQDQENRRLQQIEKKQESDLQNAQDSQKNYLDQLREMQEKAQQERNKTKESTSDDSMFGDMFNELPQNDTNILEHDAQSVKTSPKSSPLIEDKHETLTGNLFDADNFHLEQDESINVPEYNNDNYFSETESEHNNDDFGLDYFDDLDSHK